MDNTTNTRPFLESIKRIGAQARNWEHIQDYGVHLDVLNPSREKRLTFTATQFILIGAAIATLFIMQAGFMYYHIRRQGIAIEQLNVKLKALTNSSSKGPGKR